MDDSKLLQKFLNSYRRSSPGPGLFDTYFADAVWSNDTVRCDNEPPQTREPTDLHSSDNELICHTDIKSLESEHFFMARQQPDLSNSNQSPSDKSQYTSGTTDFVIEGSVDSIRTEASPDTSSNECIISAQFASTLRRKLVPGTKRTITLANKNTVQSPGMIEVLWKFANDQKSHRLKCWVLPGCTKDFVLGSKFLNMTQTLTAFSHRIKKVFTSFKLRLRLIDEEKQRLLGTFNSHVTSALADTGSDLMLVSSDFAQRRGLVIETGKEYHTEVELADGTRTWTSGIVSRVTWAIGNEAVLCDFYVMHDLAADVILSKHYLFGRDVFSKHSESFTSINSVEDTSLNCGVRLVEEELYDSEKLEREFLRDEAFNSQAVKRERTRRALAVKKIATLSLAARPEALRREEEKKERWNTARTQHRILWNTTNSRR